MHASSSIQRLPCRSYRMARKIDIASGPGRGYPVTAYPGPTSDSLTNISLGRKGITSRGVYHNYERCTPDRMSCTTKLSHAWLSRKLLW